MGAVTAWIGNSFERLSVVSLARTLKKVEDRTGSSVTNEIINLQHKENLNLSVFKEMMNSSRLSAYFSRFN